MIEWIINRRCFQNYNYLTEKQGLRMTCIGNSGKRGDSMEGFGTTGGLQRKVLIVDDDQVNREILGAILGQDYEVSYAENGREALELLQSGEYMFSLVLLDLLMPEIDGYQVLTIMREDENLKQIPVMVMTSEKDAEVVSIRLGAVDFLTKPYDMPDVIQARCQRIIEMSEGKNIIRSAEKDSLTGLYTREFFFEYIRQLEKYNTDHVTDVVVLNIVHFRMINEMFGRAEGNRVLQTLALIMEERLQGIEGIGCRPEGDTFYWYGDHNEEMAELLGLIQKDLMDAFPEARVRLRAGVYPNADHSTEIEHRFDCAKRACDKIREDYSRQISFYNSDMEGREVYHERLIRDIDDAIANHDLVVYFQPKYGILMDTPRLRSAEALIRWKHPELGMISPGDFIPLFESNGLIQKLDHYVWEEAAKQIRRWRDTYGFTLPVSVNVSRVDIYDSGMEEKLQQILEENDLQPQDLILEITESAYAENARRLVEVVEHLRRMGFMIEMDDFGSGYSSLNMLTTITIDVLKMDMKFIRNMLKDDRCLKMVELVLDIARYLGVPVVAEGVEEDGQLQILKDWGCEIVQGYYFSKPVPAEEFEAFLEEEARMRKKQ